MSLILLGLALVVLGGLGIVLTLVLAWRSHGRAATAHAGVVLVCTGAIVTGHTIPAPAAHLELLPLAVSLLLTGAWLAWVGREQE